MDLSHETFFCLNERQSETSTGDKHERSEKDSINQTEGRTGFSQLTSFLYTWETYNLNLWGKNLDS